MKTIEQLAQEFSECFPVISADNATLLGCLHEAWEGGRHEVVQGFLDVFTNRDEIEAGIEFNS